MKRILIGLLILASVSSFAKEETAVFDSCVCSASTNRIVYTSDQVATSYLNAISYNKRENKVEVTKQRLAEFSIYKGELSDAIEECDSERDKLIIVGVCPNL